MIDWTDDDKKKWEATWSEPHMKLGLLRLKLACLPESALTIAPGMDLKEIASQSDAFTKGKVSMFAEIESMKPTKTAKPLPPPFQPNPRPKQDPA